MKLPDFRWSVQHELCFREFKCSHDDVTAAVGLAPTALARKGERSERFPRRPPAVADYWGHELPERDLTTAEMNSDAPERDLIVLVGRLWDRRDQIMSITNGAEAWIETIVDSNSPRITWGCDVEIMRKLSAMNIGWVVITWSAEDGDED